jgi:hypothetical protein
MTHSYNDHSGGGHYMHRWSKTAGPSASYLGDTFRLVEDFPVVDLFFPDPFMNFFSYSGWYNCTEKSPGILKKVTRPYP